jgi:hypothetical protein
MKAQRKTQPSVSNLVKFPVRGKSPASLDELLPDKIDLLELLAPNSDSTAVTYLSGDGADTGFCENDLLVSDSSLTPVHGDFVLVHDGDGGLIVRRHERTQLRLATDAGNADQVSDEIVGVVTFCIRRVKGGV